jgi:hypothetical protein
MAQAIEDMIYTFIAQKGPTQLAEIQAWSQTGNLNIYDVNVALKRLLSTGRVYYIRRGLIVANPKKAGSLTTIQPGMTTGRWGNVGAPQSQPVSSSSWAGSGTGFNNRITL